MKTNLLAIIAVLGLFAFACQQGGEFKPKNVQLTNSADSVSYCIGLDIATSLKRDSFNAEMNLDALLMGLFQELNSDSTISIDMMQRRAVIQSYFTLKRERDMERKFGKNRIAGEKFLAENKNKEGVITTASGLQYQIITEGTGDIPQPTDRVKVHYHGTLIDGTVFDTTEGKEEPVTLIANRVIQGWQEALILMPVGSKWKLFIPQELAYGMQPQGQIIAPFSALIFDIELVEIIPQPEPDNQEVE